MNWPWQKEDRDPTKAEIMEQYWLEFIDWLQDARTIRSVSAPYDSYTELGNTPRQVALVTEKNFWLWYLDYKWSKNDASKRTQRRTTA